LDIVMASLASFPTTIIVAESMFPCSRLPPISPLIVPQKRRTAAIPMTVRRTATTTPLMPFLLISDSIL